MLNEIEIPKTLKAKVVFTSDFQTKTKTFNYKTEKACYVSISVCFGVGVAYKLLGGGNLDPMLELTIRESELGLQYLDNGTWSVFAEDVQRAYSNYLIEKELRDKI